MGMGMGMGMGTGGGRYPNLASRELGTRLARGHTCLVVGVVMG